MLMKNFIKTEKYEGQALAITMVVLVVSALIGLSIYSRSMKDKILTMEERASAEALEISDGVLEKLLLHPINDVAEEIVKIEEALEGDQNLDDGIVLIENKEEGRITELFRELGIISQSSSVGALLSPLCPIGDSEAGANEYQLTIKTADENTWIEIQSGMTWGLPAGNLLKIKENCELQLKVDQAGASTAGFIITKIYCNYDANDNPIYCEEYDVEKGFEKHCFAEKDQITCNNANFGGAWEVFEYGSGGDTIPIDMSGAEAPTEVRVVPVGGGIRLSYSFNDNNCLEGLRIYQLRVTANCSGVYRGKELLVPERKWHDSLFNYVIFNNEGAI